MSYIADFGSDATRWIGVASNMVAYLEGWLADAEAKPTPPARTFLSARRFLEWVVNGIKLDRREPAPTMASLSNWTVAVHVLTSLADDPIQRHTEVEARVTDLASTLDALQRQDHVDHVAVERLKAFFEELRQQGNAASYAEMMARGRAAF